MRFYISRLCMYALCIVCGVFVFLEMTGNRSVETQQTPAKPTENWRAKSVLFESGLLPPGEMRDICFNKTLMSQHNEYPHIQKNPLYSVSQTFYLCKKYKMLVCSVPKAGSTFWTNTMAAITGAGHNKNNVLPGLHYMPEQEMKVDYDKVKETFDGFKIITVRNPYTRLYSAYIDEVFLPTNRVLNAEIRDKTKGRLRSRQSQDPCSRNLTFSDFLVYTTQDYKAYSRSQWTPITSLCEPCENHKVLVVKEENFINDTRKVLTFAGLPEARVAYLTSVLEKKYAEQTAIIVESLIYKLFLHKQQPCLSTVEILRRIWKSLQIKGRISNLSDFPDKEFAEEVSLKMVKSDFKIAVAAASKRMSTSRIRNHRNEAVIAAYKDITPGIIADLQKIYYNDFALFNYSMSIPTHQTMT